MSSLDWPSWLHASFIRVVISLPCRSSSFPTYHRLALVNTMPSSLSPLVCICFSHPWHLLLLRLGFSTKPKQHYLHFTRFRGCCHHPALSNSGNVSGYHLAGSNKTGDWSSFVSFFRKLFISPILPFLPFFLVFTFVSFFGLDLNLNCAFASLPRFLRACRPPYILCCFSKTPPCVMCFHRSVCAKWHPFRCHLTVFLNDILNPRLHFVVSYARQWLCLTEPAPVSETWVDSEPPPSAELTRLWVWGTPSARPVAWR